MDDARKTPGDGFELWHLDSANLIMDWDTLDEALEFMRGELEGLSADDAREAVSSWGLMEVVAGKWSETWFKGDELMTLVLAHAIAHDAAAHPEKLGDVGELIKGDDELLDKP